MQQNRWKHRGVRAHQKHGRESFGGAFMWCHAARWRWWGGGEGEEEEVLVDWWTKRKAGHSLPLRMRQADTIVPVLHAHSIQKGRRQTHHRSAGMSVDHDMVKTFSNLERHSLINQQSPLEADSERLAARSTLSEGRILAAECTQKHGSEIPKTRLCAAARSPRARVCHDHVGTK